MLLRIVLLLLLAGNVYSQSVNFTKLTGSAVNNQSDQYTYYKVEIFNNTDIPICIPVSLSFGISANIYDTIEVTDIYTADDSIRTLSLYYTKDELAGSSARYPARPVVINPSTYFITNIKFAASYISQKIFLELMCSYGKGLDYNKILTSFNNQPKYMWMDNLSFIVKKYSLPD